MRFKSNGGTRPDEIGNAPKYWGVSEATTEREGRTSGRSTRTASSWSGQSSKRRRGLRTCARSQQVKGPGRADYRAPAHSAACSRRPTPKARACADQTPRGKRQTSRCWPHARNSRCRAATRPKRHRNALRSRGSTSSSSRRSTRGASRPSRLAGRWRDGTSSNRRRHEVVRHRRGRPPFSLVRSSRTSSRCVISCARGRVALPKSVDSISDVVIAFRSLRKHPRFSIVVILTIAIGIAATPPSFGLRPARAQPGDDRGPVVAGRHPGQQPAAASAGGFRIVAALRDPSRARASFASIGVRHSTTSR